MLRKFIKLDKPLCTFAEVVVIYSFPALVERGVSKVKTTKIQEGGR